MNNYHAATGGRGSDCVVVTISHLSFADLKLLIVVVDDGGGRTGGTSEGHPLVISGQLNGSLAGHGIRWVEAGSSGD